MGGKDRPLWKQRCAQHIATCKTLVSSVAPLIATLGIAGMAIPSYRWGNWGSQAVRWRGQDAEDGCAHHLPSHLLALHGPSNSISSFPAPAWPKDPAPWCGADEWGRDTRSCHSPSPPLHFMPDAGRSCRSTASLPTRNKSVQSEAKDLSLSLASFSFSWRQSWMRRAGQGTVQLWRPCVVSCFFLPHSPTSPDISAPDLSSGLRGRVGKGRGERLINISTARLLGGLIHTFPMFHPPPRIPIPAFSTCVRVAQTRQC